MPARPFGPSMAPSVVTNSRVMIPASSAKRSRDCCSYATHGRFHGLAEVSSISSSVSLGLVGGISACQSGAEVASAGSISTVPARQKTRVALIPCRYLQDVAASSIRCG